MMTLSYHTICDPGMVLLIEVVRKSSHEMSLTGLRIGTSMLMRYPSNWAFLAIKTSLRANSSVRKSASSMAKTLGSRMKVPRQRTW